MEIMDEKLFIYGIDDIKGDNILTGLPPTESPTLEPNILTGSPPTEQPTLGLAESCRLI